LVPILELRFENALIFAITSYAIHVTVAGLAIRECTDFRHYKLRYPRVGPH